jgi:hypothetical protein
LCSKYTTKPGYSQRVIGGCAVVAPPTAGARRVGAPYFASTLSIDMPLDGLLALPPGAGTLSSSAEAGPDSAAAAAIDRSQDVRRMGCPQAIQTDRL